MKVGIYLPHINPTTGGAHTYESEVLRCLKMAHSETHHDFIIFTEDSGDDQPILTGQPKLPICKLPRFSLLDRFKRILAFKLLRGFPPHTFRRWRTNKIDSVAHKHGVDLLVFFGTYHMPSDIPYVLIVWDLQHRLQPWFPEVSAEGVWDHREYRHAVLIRRATALIIGTAAGRSEIRNFYSVSEDRIHVLPMPTPYVTVGSNGSSKSNPIVVKFQIRSPFLVYPAPCSPHKNHVNLIMALKQLKVKFGIKMDLALTFNGGPNFSHIESYVEKLGLGDQVHFLGFLSRNELISLYKEAFALTFVSFFGPDNLPPLEAFALGCPVIAADVAGASEQLGDAALLVDPKIPEQIAEAIKKLFEDTELRETLITKGKERARQFTGDDFVHGLFAILDEFEPIRRCWPQKIRMADQRL